MLRIEVKFVGFFFNMYFYVIEYSYFFVGNVFMVYKLDVFGYFGLIGKYLKIFCCNINYIFFYNCLYSIVILCIRVKIK